MDASRLHDLSWFLGTVLFKATLLLAMAGVFAIALRRASAALRHLVWLLGFCGLLVLPLAIATLPRWNAKIGSQKALLDDMLPAEVLAGFRGVEAPQAEFVAALKNAPIESASDVHWRILLIAFWLAGTAVVAARIVFALRQLPRMRRNSRMCSQASELETVLFECAARVGVRRPIDLRIAEGALSMPVTWGYRRPVILIPAQAATWGIERARAVLLHELAHVRRGDWLATSISSVACALFWFHPLVWIAAKALRYESERAADDTVVRAGMKAVHFSTELLAILQSISQLQPPRERTETMIPAIPMAQAATVERRIRALLDQSITRRAVTRLQVIGTLSIGAAVLLPLATLSLRAIDTSSAQVSSAPESSTRQDTPEATVKSFVEALNCHDVRTARRCIFGANPSALSLEIERAMKSDRSTFAFGDLRSATDADRSVVTLNEVTLTDVANDRQTRRLLENQRLELRRDDGLWRIIPAEAKTMDEIAREPELTRIAAVLAASDSAANSARAKAQSVACVNNLRQLALAGHIYADAHDGRLDFAKADPMKALATYVGGDTIFTCPDNHAGGLQYVFNTKLLNSEINRVAEPNRTVFFYEGNAGSQLTFRHGDRANVAFVDGHVETCRREDLAKLRWDP